MSYLYVQNPKNGENVNIFTKLGQNILKNYIKQLGGHNGPCAIAKSGRCAKAPIGDGNCTLQNGRCVMKAAGAVKKAVASPKKASPKKAAAAPKKASPKKAAGAVKKASPKKAAGAVKKAVAAPKKASPKKAAVKKAERGCVEATKANGFSDSEVAKYQNRKSPPYPANNCPEGTVMKGNDGNDYIAKANTKGIITWRKL